MPAAAVKTQSAERALSIGERLPLGKIKSVLR
jgi:hypothetical protein